MSLNDDVQSAFHRVDVEFADKPNSLGFVVDGQPGIQLLHEPQPPLGGAEGARDGPVSAEESLRG